MILGLIFSLTGVCVLIALIFNMAIYALPLFAGLSAGRLAYDTGASWLGAILVGLVAGALTLGVGQFGLAVSRSNSNRLAIVVAFAAPAAVAGYHVVLDLSRVGGAHGLWQQILAGIGAAIIAGVALTRLTMVVTPLHQPPRTT